MELGTRLQLEFNNADAKRAVSSVVGLKKGEYLIIELPCEFEQHDRQAFLDEGNTIIIRYINNNGVVYGVKSEIIKTLYKPVKLMIVDYPKVIENHKLRKFKRSGCLMHSYVDVENLLIEGYVLNISVNGCRLSVDTTKVEIGSLKSGANVSLSMQTPGVEAVVTVEGVIRNVTTEAKKYMIGIQFGKIKSKIETQINIFLITIEEAEANDDFLAQVSPIDFVSL